MTPAEALAAHLATRPELPRPVPPVDSPEWRPFHTALQAWVDKKAALESKAAVADMDIPLEHRERVMRERACMPRADYEWRDIPKRPSRAKRPAWSGATPEYNAAKARESYERNREAKNARRRELKALRKKAA